MSGEPLDQLIEVVDSEACHLIGLPNRIWIFGGPCNTTGSPSSSLRDSFWRQTLLTTVKLDWLENIDRPEDHNGWWAFSGYEDLLQFERDACYLARATVIFSESPGSHAELGALALDNAILPRLLVVVQSKYLQEGARESFLNLGPVKRVQTQGRRCVIGTANDKILPEDDFQTIMEEIDGWLPTVPRRSLLQPKNPMHILLLLADIVDLLGVSKIEDIQKAVSHFRVSVETNELNRSLNLLNFFKFIKLEVRGSENFYVRVRSNNESPWVNYTAKNGYPPFDRSRFKISCVNRIQEDSRRREIYLRP